ENACDLGRVPTELRGDFPQINFDELHPELWWYIPHSVSVDKQNYQQKWKEERYSEPASAFHRFALPSCLGLTLVHLIRSPCSTSSIFVKGMAEVQTGIQDCRCRPLQLLFRVHRLAREDEELRGLQGPTLAPICTLDWLSSI